MKFALGFLIAAFLMSLVPLTAHASEKKFVCKKLSCDAFQPDGNEAAKSYCDYYSGPFVLQTTNEDADGGAGDKMATFYFYRGTDQISKVRLAYSVDRGGAYIAWSSDGSQSEKTHLPMDGREGTIVIQPIWRIIATSTFRVVCSEAIVPARKSP